MEDPLPEKPSYPQQQSEVLLESAFLHPVEGDRQLRRRAAQKMPLSSSSVTCHAALHGSLVAFGCADGYIQIQMYCTTFIYSDS